MISTLANMAAPPPVSGAGFAISNIARGLQGTQEDAIKRGLAIQEEQEKLLNQRMGTAFTAEAMGSKPWTMGLEAYKDISEAQARDKQAEAALLHGNASMLAAGQVLQDFGGIPLVYDRTTGQTKFLWDISGLQQTFTDRANSLNQAIQQAAPEITKNIPGAGPLLNDLSKRLVDLHRLPPMMQEREYAQITQQVQRMAEQAEQRKLQNEALYVRGGFLDVAQQRLKTTKIDKAFEFAGGKASIRTLQAADALGYLIDNTRYEVDQMAKMGYKVTPEDEAFVKSQMKKVMNDAEKAAPLAIKADEDKFQGILESFGEDKGSLYTLKNAVTQYFTKKGYPVPVSERLARLSTNFALISAQLGIIHTRGSGGVRIMEDYKRELERFGLRPESLSASLNTLDGYQQRVTNEIGATLRMGAALYDAPGAFDPVIATYAYGRRRGGGMPAPAMGVPQSSPAPAGIAPTPAREKDPLEGLK